MYLAEEKSFVDADHYRVVKAAEAEKVLPPFFLLLVLMSPRPSC
jgi:hypothetical protein